MLRGHIDGARQRIGLRPTARDPQLGVIAQLAQARAQLERWSAAAARWEARAQKLAQVPRHQVLILRPGPLNLQLTDRADLVAIAADDPGLAVLVLGFRD